VKQLSNENVLSVLLNPSTLARTFKNVAIAKARR